jgi:cell division protease FtsH
MAFKKNTKNLLIWALIIISIICIYHVYHSSLGKKAHPTRELSSFLTQVNQGRVKKVLLHDQSLEVSTHDGQTYLVNTPRIFDPIPLLAQQNVEFDYVSQESSVSFLLLIQIFLPLILIFLTWFSFFRQVQNSNGRAMGFGRSRAKIMDPEKNRIMFSDVAGVNEAKEDLEEIVDFLKNPMKFQAIGGSIPKGVLLVGPPGTGKTLLARAVAGEAGVPFFSISGSDFVEMFVGVGASRVRDLFAQAKQQSPCIIFIDEIDAVGRNRGSGMGGGHDEREQTLNQLLVEMDGFDPKEEVIIIAATNRSDVLDPALLRPGRFDRRVNVDLPDLRGREAILKVHLKKIQSSDDVVPLSIAKGTPGFSGADLANLVNEAALYAARYNKVLVHASDFEASRDKIIMGPERRSMMMTDHEKRLTAYHEGGHAVVAFHSAYSDPIHKATIIPRGGALGMVVRLPEGDRVSLSRVRLYDDLAVALAGRVAEDLIFGHEHVTTGASSDFRMATDLARRMVVEWGMSDAVGPMCYAGHSENQSFWRDSRPEYSQEVLQLIDHEVKALVERGHRTARHILTTHRDHLDLLARKLLEYETLSGHDIGILLTGGSLPGLSKNTPDEDAAPDDIVLSGDLTIPVHMVENKVTGTDSEPKSECEDSVKLNSALALDSKEEIRGQSNVDSNPRSD